MKQIALRNLLLNLLLCSQWTHEMFLVNLLSALKIYTSNISSLTNYFVDNDMNYAGVAFPGQRVLWKFGSASVLNLGWQSFSS